MDISALVKFVPVNVNEPSVPPELTHKLPKDVNVEAFNNAGMGVTPQINTEVDEFLGLGVAKVKSEALLLVSSQPKLFLKAAVVLFNAAETEPSKHMEVPYPIRSMIDTSDGQSVSVSVPLTRATLPFVPLIFTAFVAVKSGVGKEAPTVPVMLVCTKKYPPAGIVALGNKITPAHFPVPVAE